ncbi:atypical CYS HIS rich thioredoxin 4 [Actinidia rufa]|uniref:Atypical CYS HIS rich thioredoxin 4 n=1 Tax=Actinidia rufa TaxID=165716 RepID=A0A7J0E3K7_9ERIC|nr:atypical CYS HIS rich thioredoxin 4 [Actinidia rufa]GFY80726.1 atypical CYS HIS rich thioredoxin 4 [Actinidia rufa]
MSSTSMLSSSSSIHHHQNHGLSVFPTNSAMVSSRLGFSSPKKIKPLSIKSASSSSSSLSNSDFHGRRFLSQGIDGFNTRSSSSSSSLNAMMTSGIIGNAQKWWEKGLQPNMSEIIGAQDLADSLLNAGDKLVVVDFFSPSCGGCKALHPKICQFAEMNPDVQFLHVNYEEHKSMCYSLNVHVLPFFRFYRGAQGRVCSFSCTNATIKKFRDALAKHSPDRCSLGPPKGLEEKELLALAANKELSFNFTPKPDQLMPVTAQREILAEATPLPASRSEREPPVSLPPPFPLPLPSTTSPNTVQDTDKKTLVTSGR